MLNTAKPLPARDSLDLISPHTAVDVQHEDKRSWPSPAVAADVTKHTSEWRHRSDSGAMSDDTPHSRISTSPSLQSVRAAADNSLQGPATDVTRLLVDCKTLAHSPVKHHHGSSLYLRLGSLGKTISCSCLL